MLDLRLIVCYQQICTHCMYTLIVQTLRMTEGNLVIFAGVHFMLQVVHSVHVCKGVMARLRLLLLEKD